jgi:hypothetical protein
MSRASVGVPTWIGHWRILASCRQPVIEQFLLFSGTWGAVWSCDVRSDQRSQRVGGRLTSAIVLNAHVILGARPLQGYSDTMSASFCLSRTVHTDWTEGYPETGEFRVRDVAYAEVTVPCHNGDFAVSHDMIATWKSEEGRVRIGRSPRRWGSLEVKAAQYDTSGRLSPPQVAEPVRLPYQRCNPSCKVWLRDRKVASTSTS